VQRVGESIPPVQIWKALQVRFSTSQSKTSPQLLMASDAQLLPFGTQGGLLGRAAMEGRLDAAELTRGAKSDGVAASPPAVSPIVVARDLLTAAHRSHTERAL
jgi:hypothetical protein